MNSTKACSWAQDFLYKAYSYSITCRPRVSHTLPVSKVDLNLGMRFQLQAMSRYHWSKSLMFKKAEDVLILQP